MASDLGHDLARRLSRWRPAEGVVSAYVHIDPGDRGQGWRIGLREALAAVDEGAARRILERFPEDLPPPSGRTHIGFVELDDERREVWHGIQMELGRTEVVQAPRPHLAPLMQILDEGWPVGVVVLALENIRVLEWRLAEISELTGWELELTDLDWRERKAPQRNAQTGTAISAAGRDQHAQRLEQNRESFLKHAGHLLVARYGDRPWRRVILIGANDRPKLFAAGMGGRAELVHELTHDLIGAGVAAIGERVGEEVEHLNRTREEELIARLQAAINTKRGAAFGPEKVDEALEQARVRHLIFDATRDWQRRDGVRLDDLMIERALDTDAEVTPVEGLAASSLAGHGGVAALLRY